MTEPKIDVMPLDLDELFKGWVDLWEFWGPSQHLFRSVNIIEIAYAIQEMSTDPTEPYWESYNQRAWERLLRKLIKNKLVEQYRRPDDNQTTSEAYGLAARLMTYVRDNPRSTT